MIDLKLVLDKIPELFNKKTSNWVSLMVIILFTGGLNVDKLSDTITFKKDIVKEYLDRTHLVEENLSTFRKQYGADNVSIAIIHNGVFSIDKAWHLMKYSIIFSTGPDSKNTKTLYFNRPLSVWSDNFSQMLHRGSFQIDDAKTSEDILIREVYQMTGKTTWVYLPVHNSSQHLIGFLTVNYIDYKKISQKTISNMQRSLGVIESML